MSACAEIWFKVSANIDYSLVDIRSWWGSSSRTPISFPNNPINYLLFHDVVWLSCKHVVTMTCVELITFKLNMAGELN